MLEVLEVLEMLVILVLKEIEEIMETLAELEIMDPLEPLDLVETMVHLDDRVLVLLEILAPPVVKEILVPVDLLVLKVLVVSRVFKEKPDLLLAYLVVLLDLVVLEVPLVFLEKLPKTSN